MLKKANRGQLMHERKLPGSESTGQLWQQKRASIKSELDRPSGVYNKLSEF